MRLCPQCGEGYEDHVDVCPDCGAPLLADGEATAEADPAELCSELPPDEDAFDICPFRDQGQAREALALLNEHGVHGEVGSVDLRRQGASLFHRQVLAVRVARADARRAMELLVSEVPHVLPQDVLEEVWRALAEQEPELPAGLPSVLAEPLEVLLAGGPELVPDLIRGYRYAGQVGSRCHYVLVHMQADPEPTVAQAAMAACLAGDAEAVGTLRFLLTDLAGERTVDALRTFLAQADAPARQLTAWLLGAIPMIEAVTVLVEMLDDADLDVRVQAIETLSRVAGQDLGFEPEAGQDERAQAVAAWWKFLEWAQREFYVEREDGRSHGSVGEGR